ncbi:unnamed protein product [Parnassius apollo]|uniref:(apollo) hypothetical protein n=1 Tax=Parnassius apollo TaxID=110799 RepID=A0A8S3XK42_PARAO|nr:unnamed protein product [Parnassius apollo]
MLLPLFVLAVILNMGAKLNNYNIKKHPLDIRVKRDVVENITNNTEAIYEDNSLNDTSHVQNNTFTINETTEALMTSAQDDESEEETNTESSTTVTSADDRFKNCDELVTNKPASEYEKNDDLIVAVICMNHLTLENETHKESGEISEEENVGEKNDQNTEENIEGRKQYDSELPHVSYIEDDRLIKLIYNPGRNNTMLLPSKSLQTKNITEGSSDRVKRNTPYSNNENNYSSYPYPYTNSNGSWIQKLFPRTSFPYARNYSGPVWGVNRFEAKIPSVNKTPFYSKYNSATGHNTIDNVYRQSGEGFSGTYVNYTNLYSNYPNYPNNANSTNIYNPSYNQSNNGFKNLYNSDIYTNNFYNNYNLQNSTSNSTNNINGFNSISPGGNPKYVTPGYNTSNTTGYKVTTTTTPPIIVESCFLCVSVGCPAFFKKIGFMCVPVDEV